MGVSKTIYKFKDMGYYNADFIKDYIEYNKKKNLAIPEIKMTVIIDGYNYSTSFKDYEEYRKKNFNE